MADREDTAWRTAISTARSDTILYRGYDLEEIIGELDFASTAFLLVKGETPTESQARVFNALLAATADHGISPSQAVTRYVSASGSPIQASVAAGILTIGDYHGGAGEIAAELFDEHLEARDTESLSDVARRLVDGCRDRDERVPGYGHPEHENGDPRAPALISIARDETIAGEATDLALSVEDILTDEFATGLRLNINGVTAALLLDLGLRPSFARPLVIMARVPGLISHAIEERERERVWRTVSGGVTYDGPEGRTLDDV